MPLAKKSMRKPPSRAIRAHQTEQLQATATQLDNKRDHAKALAEQISELQASALELLDVLGIEEHSWTGPSGKLNKIKRSQTSSDIVDESRLRNRLGSAMWNKVTTRVLDKNKLKAHVASGEIDPKAIAECSTTKDNNPFVKVT